MRETMAAVAEGECERATQSIVPYYVWRGLKEKLSLLSDNFFLFLSCFAEFRAEIGDGQIDHPILWNHNVCLEVLNVRQNIYLKYKISIS